MRRIYSYVAESFDGRLFKDTLGSIVQPLALAPWRCARESAHPRPSHQGSTVVIRLRQGFGEQESTMADKGGMFFGDGYPPLGRWAICIVPAGPGIELVEVVDVGR